MRIIRTLIAVPILSVTLWAGRAAAAESYDSCAGHYIDSLPAVITSQGTWCLRNDLSTAIASGDAIGIATNNVTIDCNGYKVGGLAAGDTSLAYGIHAVSRQNLTVRNCNVRGFYIGIVIIDGNGHLVADNRLDNNLAHGIVITGGEGQNLVRGNAVYDTGGSPGQGAPSGMHVRADAIDNTVSGVFSALATASPYGIILEGVGTVARGNQVRGLVPAGTGHARGMLALGFHDTVTDNTITATAATSAGTGIAGTGATDTFCSNNTVAAFDTAIEDCQDAGGNHSH